MFRITALAASLMLSLMMIVKPVMANDQQELVNRAKISVDSLRSDPNLGKPINNLLKRAYGVMVFPNLFKAGFILGGEGGNGVLMVKGPDGTWSSPAFFGMGSGSLGLQIGVQQSEVMLIIMNEGGLRKILNNSMKLGADASVAVGPVGAGIEASTTANMSADIYTYSKASGLFGGGSLEGSVLSPREEWNAAYYGSGSTTRAIVVERKFENYGSNALKAALNSKE
ncbi:MAG: lipid-binding SYLF domain-containing protein [Elstera sp.]